MRWAVALLPTPILKSAGIGRMLRQFPVKINDLGTDTGRALNPATASCAAAYTLVVFTESSVSKVETGRERILVWMGVLPYARYC